tara:strand:+ start:4798 stop:5046 length:249 start_codon:yes stop_codon:yes gene_type:complete
MADLKKVKQLKNDYAIVFGSEEGKRVLHDILMNTHVLEPTFTEDPYRTAFNEGARNESLRMLSILQYSPQDFITTAQEINDE